MENFSNSQIVLRTTRIVGAAFKAYKIPLAKCDVPHDYLPNLEYNFLVSLKIQSERGARTAHRSSESDLCQSLFRVCAPESAPEGDGGLGKRAEREAVLNIEEEYSNGAEARIKRIAAA